MPSDLKVGKDGVNAFERELQDLTVYSEITGNPNAKEDTQGLTSIVVRPTSEDYDKGFYKRYFICRYDANEANEVDADFYQNKVKDLAPDLYTSTHINWYLNSKKLPRLNLLKPMTTENVNEHYVHLASKRMPQLLKTIEDFSKFVR